MNPRRLYRSADDRILAGVAGGVAAYFDVDPVIVRIIWFLSVFFTGTLTFWAYLVMIVVVPLEPGEWPAPSPWAPGGGPSGYANTYTPPVTTAPVDPATGAPAATGPVTAGTTAAPGDPNANPAAGAGAAPGVSPNAGPTPAGWWGYDWRAQRRQERWQRRAERWQQRAEGRDRGYNGPGLVFGLLLILVGGMLAWHQFDPNFDLNLTWPVVVIAFGAILVISSLRFRDR